MLIDDWMPLYHAVERHAIGVDAPTEATLAAVSGTDLAESAVVRWLFRLRGLPSRTVRLADMERLGFARLAEDAGREVVYGLVGRFWRPTGGLVATGPEHFRTFDEPGYAMAAWSFHATTDPARGGAVLATETRIGCTDRASRRWFGLYWAVVAPFSGWTRREMLRLAKHRAEKGSPATA